MQDGLANAGPGPHQVQDVGRLELAHNGCVDALRRLLSKRLELVQLMFGTDTLEADWEQAQCTPHAAQCTPHAAQCTPHCRTCTACAPRMCHCCTHTALPVRCRS